MSISRGIYSGRLEAVNGHWYIPPYGEGTSLKTPKPSAAIRAINRLGCLLVYPIDNQKEPRSLWSEFYPRSPMRWEWDSGGDNRVADLWHLREELSRSGQVIYAKWFRGRATFLSRALFPHLLATLAPGELRSLPLKEDARKILDTLEMDSPLSTKQLKERCDLRGKFFESTYARATKELWQRLLLVGYGERDDGAFPSLVLGATPLLFEDLWLQSRRLVPVDSAEQVKAILGADSPFLRFWQKLRV